MDLIDREKLKEAIKMAINVPVDCEHDIGYNDALINAVKIVDSMPTVDAQPVKHGRWERTDMFVKCSECGVELLDEAFFGIHVFDNGYMPFCPNCSSKMNGVDAE